MPYIPQRTRSIILDATGKVDPAAIETVGELNFAITHLVNAFCKGDSYIAFNEIIGVLESAKLEFYRRRVAPYEDQKIAENGDVYGPSSSGAASEPSVEQPDSDLATASVTEQRGYPAYYS